MNNKAKLPKKICVVCQKPFNWRKKWARDWEQVKYCSKRCLKNKKKSSQTPTVNEDL